MTTTNSEMSDDEFLSYCFLHAETPVAGFVPKQIVRLLTLADEKKYKENIDYFQKRENSIINCEEAEIKQLVKTARKRLEQERSMKAVRPKIVTAYAKPVLPWRDNDWCAWIDGREEDETAPRGWGKTEELAIADLYTHLDEELDYDES